VSQSAGKNPTWPGQEAVFKGQFATDLIECKI